MHVAGIYEKIAKKMGTSWSEEMEKILKALYSPEEALTMVKRFDKVPEKNMMQAMAKNIEGKMN